MGWRSGARVLFFLKELRPVHVAGGDETRDVLLPLFPNVEVVVLVKFVIHDLPCHGVDAGGVVLADRPGAIAAKLRCLLGGFGLEKGEILGRGKAPRGTLPLGGEGLYALDRFGCGELGDGIVALDGDAEERGVDRFFGAKKRRVSESQAGEE